MTWLRLDDLFPENPKIVGLTDGAFRLHVGALCYSARNLTDGVVSRKFARSVIDSSSVYRHVRQLEDRLLWAPIDRDYWQIHDYLEWNPSRAEVLAKREVARANALRRWRPTDE